MFTRLAIYLLLLFKISFVKTDSKNCEDILNKLKALGVGRTAGTSIRYYFWHAGILCMLLSGDNLNISILHLSCRTSDLQFSLILQTHALVH